MYIYVGDFEIELKARNVSTGLGRTRRNTAPDAYMCALSLIRICNEALENMEYQNKTMFYEDILMFREGLLNAVNAVKIKREPEPKYSEMESYRVDRYWKRWDIARKYKTRD